MSTCTFWGLGAHANIFGGETLSAMSRIAAEILRTDAAWQQDQAGIAARTAGYQRRADEWTLQANLAARELMQIGRQIIASLIAEQVAYHDYLTVKTQVQQAQDVQAFLEDKFTSAVFYTWMQSDLSGLYYQYYRFAYDTARQAEQTMKQELMRPELDATQFIQFNYWDSGHQGLLSGEALYLDIKRMEMAYHDNNKRELELTRHVSLRQLDPLALLTLRITGSCTVTVPEWLYDRDCPGHYMRRIKSRQPVGAVGGRPVHQHQLHADPAEQHGARLAPARQRRLRSRHHAGRRPLRRLLRLHRRHRHQQRHQRQRHVRDQPAGRALPALRGRRRDQHLEPVAARAAARIRLHDDLRRDPACPLYRQGGGDPLSAQATKELEAMLDTAGQSSQALMFCLRYDFPTEWSAFVNGTGDFAVTLQKQYFPYAVQSANQLTIDALTLYAESVGSVASVTPTVDLAGLSAGLSGAPGEAPLSLPGDGTVLTQDLAQQVFLVLQYHFGMA